ncbi:energy-coupling factor ABC transporter ATP-binding protein [Thermodesulfobacterium hydrogeniphilum]|uniref:energy-coupling factor ABC transporter ATP-binding protein n=1 Tax=Thermodesulfobacterium hydrogeniphilum TaxID=161156 RepID=UPI00056F00B0|nr:ABC transporter ATP-binding protein [Thermodesulfobacterium hydrogeniphilum]
MEDILIKLENITFSYNSFPVLKNINFEVRVGDKVGLVGPNGAGKTTLLYIITGFLRPQKGKIIILGKERKKEKDFIEVRQKIGLLFQDSDSQLFCPTVKEDIAFGPLNLGKSKEEVLKIVQNISDLFNIHHLLERPIYKLSGGEKKLVALAGIFAMNPICYLLDEPSAGLDEKTKFKLIEFLKNYVKNCVIVSHDKEFLKEIANKTYYLEKDKFYKIL